MVHGDGMPSGMVYWVWGVVISYAMCFVTFRFGIHDEIYLDIVK
jgi:hypothetical protein